MGADEPSGDIKQMGDKLDVDGSNPEIASRLFHQTLELYINPELEKRKEAGRLPQNFELQIAQVIMNVDRPIEVRLNDEVKAVLQIKARNAIQKGAPVFTSDIEEITGAKLTDHDPNAAHLTIISHEGKWYITFDFQYNAERIHHHLEAAAEFLETAKDALKERRHRAFLENLFATTELLAKAWLLKMPLEPLVKTSRHTYIKTQLNSHSKLGNFQSRYAQLYNYLCATRDKARYVNARLQVTEEDCAMWLETAEEMLTEVTNNSPKRMGSDDKSE